MNKANLIRKIKSLEGLTNDEKADLIHLLNETKQYGLVWEEKPEDVEGELLTKLPVLKEVIERRILAKDIQEDDSSKSSKSRISQTLFTDKEDFDLLPKKQNFENAPNHILIEGDNLHALTALTFTHQNKIDVIYIDPPYNTGKKNEFKYNDRWVDSEDSYRHSKWLSFINKRLKLAFNLLSDNGLLFVSIDDNEIAQVKMLLDDLFDNRSSNPNDSNCLGVLIWNLGTGTQAGHFVRSHEYVLAYTKNKKLLSNFKGDIGIIEHSALKKISKKNPASEFCFPKGTRFNAKNGTELKKEWGGSEKMYLISGKMISENGKLQQDVILKAGYAQKKQMESWFSNQETYDSKGQKVIEFYFNSSGILKYIKDRGVKNPKTVISEVGSTKTGSEQLKNILGEDAKFDYPKPLELVKLLTSLPGQNVIILDFFAGSGTTLHATMQLNLEDKGNRQCILVTNNENNIAEEVCYERNKRVINGYTNTNGIKVEGLICNNLRYYKTDFVSQEKTIKNKKQLTLLATEMLCIKENIYSEIADFLGFTFSSGTIRCFTENEKYLFIIYDEEYIEQLTLLINQIITPHKIKVYVFSPGQYPFTEEFVDVISKVEVCALPDAIYKAYMNVLPKSSDRRFSEVDNIKSSEQEKSTEVEADLFTENNPV